MPDFERFEEFSEGSVLGASIELRPDAVVPLVAQAPGPVAIGNTASGLLASGWYVRPDEDLGKILIAVATDAETWGEESELLDIPGSGGEVEMISLAFDSSARPIVGMKIQGEGIYLYRWDEGAGSYSTSEVVADGENPCLVARASGTSFHEVVLFYQRGNDVLYAFETEAFGTEYDVGFDLLSTQKLWRAIDGAGGRLHLIYSEWDEDAGTYSLGRLSEESSYSASCLETEGEDDVVSLGVDSVVVFRGDGSLTARCDIECDFLIIGAGGDAGDSGSAEDSVVWADTATGLALDPSTDPVPTDLRARGGGHGASNDFDGSQGGSGGGGGGASPSNNSMWTAGGGIVSGEGQGNPGGGGESTWGLLDPKRAASGGGGGYGGAGSGGTTLRGSPLAKGLGGAGGILFTWNGWPGPRGGDGAMASVSGASTGSVPGGGGAGGVEQYNGLVIPAGTTIPIRVGQGYFAAQAGEGGGDQNTGDGITGLVAIKIRRVDLSEKVPAEAQKVISGGTESVLNDYRYFKFTSDGTLTVTGEGTIEALVVGAGGGGGSDAGGGGGAGEVKIVDLVVAKDQDVVVGAGGAGGTSGGAGADGEDSSIGSMTAQGGGGGAGEGTAAGSRASGGGGHGDAGDPGAGSTFRANGGGAGGGYSLAGGGDARHAGGGGGVGAPGTKGATEETTGDPLADTWETPTAGFIEEANNIYVIGNLGGGTHRGLISELVNREDMFVQGRVISAHSNLHVGIRARGRHTAGGDDDPTEGWPAFIDHNNQRFRFTTYLFDLGSSHLLQAYVEDSLQEYAVQGPNGFPRTVSIVRDSNNDTTYNGLSRSFGFYCEGSPIFGTNKAGKCVHLACFASKWLLIGNAPSGGRGEVLNEAGEVVAEANESGGDLEFDLSLYGDGTDGTGEEVPLPGGFPRVRIYDSGDSLVVDAAGTFYPGGEFDVSGSSVEVRTDSSGAEPVPILGLLHYSDFSETTPGPELGDGGDGIELDDPDWVVATGIGDDDGYLGGGGGAGSEATIAGPGGQGGGGAGAYDTETPEDGEANTGGGGGGSGDSTVDGGDGGSGLVVVRSLRFDPDTVPEASRFSESALDQDNDGGIILDPATEQVTFGDNTAWNGLTAFTIVIRWQPNSLGSQRDIFSRHSTSPSLKRGIEVFQRQGTQFAALISSNGTDYAALWRNGGLFTGQDYIYAVVFDGSLTGGGNNKNRLRPLRLDGPMASWTDVGWDFEFYGSRSDVPASLATLTGVDELLGHRADGAGDPNPGVCKLLAIKYGTAYSAAELDAMDLYDEENIDLSDWDRLHRFQGHIADEIGSTDGTFTDPV